MLNLAKPIGGKPLTEQLLSKVTKRIIQVMAFCSIIGLACSTEHTFICIILAEEGAAGVVALTKGGALIVIHNSVSRRLSCPLSPTMSPN